MSTVDKLTIRIDGPEQWPSLPPQDDLYEMPHFDFAMQRYLFDNNHRILLTIGKFKRSLHFFPDIALAFPFLPGVILSLVCGEPVDLTFPDSQMFLKCLPHNGELDCTVGTFGTEPSEHLVILDANRTTSELKGFLQDILGRAVTGGYVSREEADEFARGLTEVD